MSFAIRGAISVLAGMGAGAVGYWVASNFLDGNAVSDGGFHPWMLVAIFAPGILVALGVYWTTSPKEEASSANPARK
jgi:hypothetical protein